MTIKLKKEKYDKKVLIKITGSDLAKMKAQAVKYTNGNLSQWIRYASQQEPSPDDVKKVVVFEPRGG